jgi:hypothetical protein
MYEHAFIFVINFFNIVIIGIVYNALMHKIEFGQAYSQDLHARIIKKFILHFMSFTIVSMKFGTWSKLLGII